MSLYLIAGLLIGPYLFKLVPLTSQDNDLFLMALALLLSIGAEFKTSCQKGELDSGHCRL